MSNSTVVNYTGAIELVNRLHSYPRVDGQLHHVDNTFPDFGPGSGDYEQQYAESLLMPAAIPIVILFIYFMVEIGVRVLISACGLCDSRGQVVTFRANGPPSDSSGLDSDGLPLPREKLRKTRCYWAGMMLLLVGIFFMVIASLVKSHDSSSDTQTITNNLDVLRNTYNGVVADADSGYAALVDAGSAANTIAAMDNVSVEAQADATQAAQAIAQAEVQVQSLQDTLAVMDFSDIVDRFNDQASRTYGARSYTTALLLGGSFFILLFVVVEGLMRARRRNCAENSILIIYDLLVMVALILFVCVPFLQLGLLMGVSDVCVSPVSVGQSIARAHFSSDPDARDTVISYLYCDPAHPSPLQNYVNEAFNKTSEANSLYFQLYEYSLSQDNPALNASVTELGLQLSVIDNALVAATLSIACPSVHNPAFSALNSICVPFVQHVYALLCLEVLIAIAWLVVRGAAVYRCCRCCYISDSEGQRWGEGLSMRPRPAAEDQTALLRSEYNYGSVGAVRGQPNSATTA